MCLTNIHRQQVLRLAAKAYSYCLHMQHRQNAEWLRTLMLNDESSAMCKECKGGTGVTGKQNEPTGIMDPQGPLLCLDSKKKRGLTCQHLLQQRGLQCAAPAASRAAAVPAEPTPDLNCSSPQQCEYGPPQPLAVPAAALYLWFTTHKSFQEWTVAILRWLCPCLGLSG